MTTPNPPGGTPDDPTQRIPATPPSGAPVSQAPPPAGRPAPAGDPKNKALPWQIATGVLALSTIGLGLWGFSTNSKLNDLQASTDQQIATLQEQMKSQAATAGKKEAEQAKEITALRANIKEYKGNLKVDTSKLKADAADISKLSQEYRNAQRNAAAKEDNLNAQLRASNAQAALAKKCASVMASGLIKLYEDVPTVVTYKEVDAVLQQASDECGDVINVEVP